MKSLIDNNGHLINHLRTYSKHTPWWNSELSYDKDLKKWWVNVGYHMPLTGSGTDIKMLLSYSAYEYARKFN